MALTENHMDEIQSRLAHIRRKQLSGDRIYNFQIAFDKLYDKLSDAEKKEFMGTFVESIELYPERLENGKFLKHIHFRFPVYYNGTVIDDISWEMKVPLRRLSYFPRALKVRWTFAQRAPKWNGEWPTAEK